MHLMNEIQKIDYYIDKLNIPAEIAHAKYNIIMQYINDNLDIIKNIDYERLNIDCNNCNNCIFCINCNNCNNCYFCDNCLECDGCYSCNDCGNCDACCNCEDCGKCLSCYYSKHSYKICGCHNSENVMPNIQPLIKYSINQSILFKPKNLNPFLANLSELYNGFHEEGLDIINDEEIIKNMKDFDNFNKINNTKELNKIIKIIIDLNKCGIENEFIDSLIYNINYLQLKECIEILVENNIIRLYLQ